MCANRKQMASDLAGALIPSYDTSLNRLAQETRDKLWEEIIRTTITITKGEMSTEMHKGTKERFEENGETYPKAGLVSNAVVSALVERDKVFLVKLQEIQKEYYPEDEVVVEVYSMTQEEFDNMLAEAEDSECDTGL